MRNKAKKKPSERNFAAVLANVWPLFAKDAEPGDITEAVEDLIEAIQEEVAVDETAAMPDAAPAAEAPKQDEAAPAAKDEEMPAWAKVLMQEIKDCKDQIAGMKDKKDTDPLEKLEAELSGESGEAEAELIEPAEDIETGDADTADIEAADSDGDVTDEAGFIAPPSDRHKTMLNKDAASFASGSGSADRRAVRPSGEARERALNEIRRIKPIIAKITDTRQRRVMSDSMVRLIRATYGFAPQSQGVRDGSANNYAAVMETRKRNAQARIAKDAKPGGSPQDAVADLAAQKISETRKRLLMQKTTQ